MKNLFFIAINIFIVVIILTACNNESFQQNENMNSQIVSTLLSDSKIPKTMNKKLGDNLVVDAAIDGPDILPKAVRQIPVKIKALENKQRIIKTIFGDESTTKSSLTGAKDREGNSTESEHLRSVSGKRLLWYGNMLTFSTELGYDINEAFIPSENDNQYPAKDLAFMNQEEVKKETSNFLKLLGVTVDKNVHVNSLDYQTMEQIQLKQYKELKATTDGILAKKIRPLRNWTKDDDCYALQFKQVFDGISISDQTFGDSRAKTETYGPTIHLYYGKQGYISGVVAHIYQETGSLGQMRPPIDLDTALNVLQNKFDEIIMGNPIKITNIEFSYVPKLVAVNKESYILNPCWIFKMSQYSEDIKSNVETRIIIDALTGKEVD